jgi:hypothetical protein
MIATFVKSFFILLAPYAFGVLWASSALTADIHSSWSQTRPSTWRFASQEVAAVFSGKWSTLASMAAGSDHLMAFIPITLAIALACAALLTFVFRSRVSVERQFLFVVMTMGILLGVSLASARELARSSVFRSWLQEARVNRTTE